MASPRDRDSFEGEKTGGVDPVDRQLISDELQDSASTDALPPSIGENSVSRSDICLTERLTDVIIEERDGDLLLQHSDRGDRLLQWLQALDMQVTGACRADERLKPLLKMKVSSGVAEDHLLAHLSQHFEPAEVGMLARCFCIPLVSIRVGKIDKQGTRLCPTNNRGNLNLSLLPTSALRLSFTGDNGHVESIFTLTSISQCSAVVVDEIPADSSGRSFLVRIPNVRTFYFWCSEKSRLLGIELLSKMKDLLRRKPSIAELSGISKSRIHCFATHLRSFLVGSKMGNNQTSYVKAPTVTTDIAAVQSDVPENIQIFTSKFPRSRCTSGQRADSILYKGSSSLRPNSFKDGPPKSLSSFQGAAARELRQHGDGHLHLFDDMPHSSASTMDASSNQSGSERLSEFIKSGAFSPSSLEPLDKLAVLSSHNSLAPPPPLVSSILSPYYCWCPPGVSSLPSQIASSQIPCSLTQSLSLPPLSSLLPVTMPASLLTSTPPLNLSNASAMDFPSFLPDPVVCLPRSPKQIPTFTPLMCDPIVHVPLIDVCSSGQGYLVSAGPAIATSIPPLHPNLIQPLVPEADSMVEKGARETLRLLIGSSSQANPQMMDILPAVLSKANEKQNIVVGSRGLYSGTRDIGVIANSIAAMGLASLSNIRGDAEVRRSSSVSKEDAEISGNSVDASPADVGGGVSESQG